MWHLFEYIGFAFAIKKLRLATIEGRSSAIRFFHLVSRGFELDTTHPLSLMPSKVLRVRMPTLAIKQPCAGLYSWPVLLTGETLIPV